jgi:hypothetical protein
MLDYHTLAEVSCEGKFILLAVRGEKNVARWEKILGFEPGYPIEGAIMPIAVWIYMDEDVSYNVIHDTILAEQELDGHKGRAVLLSEHA